MATATIVQRTQVTEFLIRAIRTVVSAITQLLSRQTDGVIGSTHVVRQLAHQRFAVVLIRVVLTVTVAITHPGLADAASRVPAAKLDCWVTHVGHTLAVALITQVHTVCIPITAPAHGNAQAIHPTLELIYMTAAWRTGSLVGTVGVSLITVVSTVIVAITGPVFRDAAATVAFELDTGAGMAAAGLITVIPTVIVVITAPVDVDAAAIGAGELGQREAGWVGAGVWFI